MHARPLRRLAAASAALALAAGLAPAPARASGFYLTDRGVRPMGRAGAFVAGADDAHAVWYNPAGLVHAGRGVLVDGSYLHYSSTYTREVTVDPAAAPLRYAPVSAHTAPLVIPTLVATHDLGLRGWMFAAGVLAPNAVVPSYPETPRSPEGYSLAPQRYSLFSLEGTMLAVVGAWAAYAPSPTFSVGAGVQLVVGSMSAFQALSGCPATITCQPENPEWDAVAKLNIGPIVAPTGNAGVRWQPSPYVVLGLSGALPVWVNAPATLAVRLPSAAYFDGAQVRGDRAGASFVLPPVVRAGIEVRPTPATRVELAGVIEFWDVHDKITLERAEGGIQITNLRGVGTYDVGATALQRRFRNAYSVRLGGEHDVALGGGWHVTPRLGVAYDTSATAPAYTTVLTQDADKVLATAGVSVTYGSVRVDAMYLHAFVSDVNVPAAAAAIPQVAPFRTNDQAPMHGVNGGRYEMSLDVFGLGARVAF